jgi:serine/threonine-protein kinase
LDDYNPALSLQPGVRLGVYEIVAPVGAGGMGEVYRAHDPALNRDVALKILPEAFAVDPDRLARFTREAQVLASLNHPHIAHVYGLERRDGPDGRLVSLIVMELVEGDDLSRRLAQGAMPLDEVVPIARQIAEALEAAHDQGVIHRDLKPANVKVRADGTVKVLDFGLAKALDPSGVVDPMNSPTLTTPAMMTRAGIILGTASYMAPEQARGKAVDKRADIWAFGCVLFEMLTGRPLFGGETVTETLASVLRDAPQLDALPPNTPPHVRRLLARCLERDPRQRLRDVGEARIALSGATTDSGSPPAVVVTHRSAAARVLPWTIAAIAVIGAIAAWVMRQPANPPPLRKLELSIGGSGVAGPAISPDGKRIAFLADGHLRVRDLDQLGSRDIGAPPPIDRNFVFWSADSAFLGYATADGKLWKIPATGGAPVLLCAIPETGRLIGAGWRPDGSIVLAAWQGSLYQVASTGGKPALFAAIDPAKELDFHFPVIAPDGRILVSTHLQSSDKDRITEGYRVEILDGRQRQTVLEAARLQVIAYLDAGYLLIWRFDQNPGLWALRFSGRLPLRIDDAFVVAPGAILATAARDGTLLYSLASDAPQTRELVWVDRAGHVVGPIGAPQLELFAPSLSPDGQRVAFSARVGDNVDVWVRDIGSNAQSRLTFGPTDDSAPAWFPSGQRLVYTEVGATTSNRIVVSNADGSGGRRELMRGLSPAISHDGRHIVYLVEERGALRLRYAALDAGGTAGPEQRLFKSDPEPNVVPPARVSPDGSFVAYTERQPSGDLDVFVTRFPSGEGRWQISTGGGRTTQWVRDANELMFVSGPSAVRGR